MPPEPDIRALIRPHTGDISELRPTKRGYSSNLTAVVTCEKGPFFVKVMRNRPGGYRASIRREQFINRFVRPLSPALGWVAQDESWIVLGFEAVEAREADFLPGCADLPAVAELLDRICALPFPEAIREWTETRWDRFAADPADVELFRGDALLHTDINPSNLLIGERDNWVVDWAWPTRGAAFIDPHMLVIQLISAGHTPESAERWVSDCPAWRNADPRALDAFAAADVRMHRHIVQRQPDAEWRDAMLTAALAWATYRGGHGLNESTALRTGEVRAQMTNVLWHKSSYSGLENDCVEVGRGLRDAVPVRDSKNPTGPHLTFAPDAWAEFIAGVKSGAYDA
jgi:hypothetical protein